MIKTKASKLKLMCLLIITLSIFLTLIINSIYVSKSEENPPIAINGEIDLRNWSFKKDGMIKLSGQWEFYKNQLLTPEDFKNNKEMNKEYVSVPGTFGGRAYGTYRLKILDNRKKDIYSLKIDYIQNAFKLWANDSNVMSVGKVGTTKEEMIPQLIPKDGCFYNENGDIYLTLQVSNFYTSQGYIDTVLLGEATAVKSYTQRKLAFDLFLFGSTVIAAIYNLGVYHKRKTDKATLYFAIVCIIVAIRTLFIGEGFFISLFPQFPFILSTKIKVLTFYLYIPFIALFINMSYGKILSKKIIRLSNISAIAYTVIVIISPTDYYLLYIFPFEALSLFMLLYMMIKISKVYIKSEQSDYIAIVGLFALFIARVNDILYEYSLIITGSYAPLGIFIFIIANYFVLAERQSLAFNNMEKMSEKLESINNLKDEFLATTSHELKTPLNGIIGLSESLNSSNFTKEEQYNLYLINSSAKRLSNLVNDIMVFSRLKNNEIILDRRPANISKIVEMVLRFSEPTISNKNITLLNLVDSNVPFVYGDENRLQQIFYNLIGNAVKFTQEGTISVHYAMKIDYLEITVADTGMGISREKINTVFDIYEQVDGVSEKYGGTGLGLYITRKLIELHGGTIRVESIVNKGSKFIFTLPLCTFEQLAKYKDYNETGNMYLNQCKNNSTADYVAADSIGSRDHDYKNTIADIEENMIIAESVSKGNFKKERKYKILVVDDEYVNLKVLENYLSKDCYELVKAFNGKEALKVIGETNDLDLVILDMMMPDYLGYEICKIIREKYSLFDLPVLIMTAENRLENLVVSFENGANDYLKKPFNKHELSSRVNTLLTLKNSVQEALLLAQQVDVAYKEMENLSLKNEENSKRVEELMEYDKVKTEFFANISHELRTPLNVICSTIQLLTSIDQSKEIGDEKIKYYFSIMKQNSLRLLRLINNLIDTTKVDGGYLHLNLKNGDIVYVVEEISQSVAEYIKTHGITLIFDTELEEKIMCFDEEKIERVILNILSNAVKFTDKNGTIYVNIYDKGNSIQISIRDTGIGIPKDKLEFIFERFAQIDKSTTRKSEGSGIGLALVKSLVDIHGGSIMAHSEVGRGSEFIITLPIKTISDEGINNSIIHKEVEHSKYIESLSIEFSDIYFTK